MLKINFYGNSPFYQIDKSYNLPSCTGAVQWNGNTKRLEVSTGSTWVTLDNEIYLAMGDDIEKDLSWIRNKRKEEEELMKLSEAYPTVTALLEKRKEIDAQISMITTLVKKETKV